MTSEINIFLRNLLQYEHEPVNMALVCQRVAADIAGHLAFGQSLKTQTEAANRTLINAMASVNGLINICSESLHPRSSPDFRCFLWPTKE